MHKRFVFILFLLLLNATAFCQQLNDTSYVDIAQMRDSMLIINKTLLFFDSNEVANMGNIMQQKFVPLSEFTQRKNIPVKLVPKYAYLKIGLYNSNITEDTVLFFPGGLYDNIKVYKLTKQGEPQLYSDASKTGFARLIMAPGTKDIFMFTLDFCRNESNTLSSQIIKPGYLDSYKRIYRSRVETQKIIGYITSGMLFIIILFVVANYFLYRKKEFLYFLGYAGFNFLLMLIMALLNFITGSLASLFYGYMDLIFLILGGIFYLAFTRYFLDTKNEYKLLDKAFRITEIFLALILVLYSFVHFFSAKFYLEVLLENLMKVILLSVGVLFIYIAFKQRKRLLTYLAVGNAFAIFFSVISLILIWQKVNGPSVFSTAIFYYNLSIVFPLAFFLLGLTYKNRTELIENLKQQAALKIDMERQELENQISLIKAQQEERNRISADMHDDLGAGMTTIRLYSELAKNRLGTTEVPEIEKISSSANELLTKMNAIIWSMSSSNDSLGNMVAYIRSYSLEYFENTGINCIIKLPDDLPNLVVSGPIRRNVFLVVKEALNNVLKHSGATELRITLEKVSDGLKLYIHDNGKGIDFEKIRQFGNGLKNMKKRMDDIGIGFSIENNNGTLITLHRVINGFNPV